MSMYYGPSRVDGLLMAIDACCHEWGDDPAYKKAAQALREVETELRTLSPGQQAAQNAADYSKAATTLKEVAREVEGLAEPEQRTAARAQGPNQTGQHP